MKPRPIDVLLQALVRLKYPNYGPMSNQPMDKQLAFEFGIISPQAFSNYKLAKRKPDKARLTTMARAWAGQLNDIAPDVRRERLAANGFRPDRDLIEEFTRHLKAATLPTAHFDRPRRVSSLDYGVFSGAQTGEGAAFFESLSERYFRQLGITLELSIRKSAVESELDAGAVDLLLCFFASTSRVATERFFRTPLRISLGAVTDSRYSDRLEQIARCIYTRRAKQDVTRIRPMVVEGEVGHQHCLHALGMNKDDMLIQERLDVPELTAALRRELLAADLAAEADPVPVLIVDEYTALRVYKNLASTGLFVIPLTSSKNNEISAHRREMPQYFMSIAWSRRKPFQDFLEESLDLFLTSEVNTTAHALAQTFWKLDEEVRGAIAYMAGNEAERRLAAREFALYSLSLDPSTVRENSYARFWQDILVRAKKMISEEMVSGEKREDTKRFIQSILGGAVEAQLTKNKQIDYLARYTGQTELDLNDYRGHYEEEVFELLRRKILPDAALDDEFSVVDFDPNNSEEIDWRSQTDVRASAANELLHQLGEMYWNLRVWSPSESIRVGRDICNLVHSDLNHGFKRYARVVLAIASSHTVTGRTQFPAGILCILPQPGCAPGDTTPATTEAEREHLSQSCELRYLWVAEVYRKRHISRILLARAVRWCRDQQENGEPKYRWARVAILPQLSSAIEHVRQMGFRTSARLRFDEDSAPGRFVFERDLRALHETA